MVITSNDKNYARDTVKRIWGDTGNYSDLISACGFNAVIKDFFYSKALLFFSRIYINIFV